MVSNQPLLRYEDLLVVETQLGYIFRDRWILAQAFLVPGVSSMYDNTRLAWIGDQAMGLAICERLFNQSLEASVEALNDRKTIMVKRTFCAECTEKMGWSRITVGAKMTPNLQAELFEAVLGAVFVDSYGDYKGTWIGAEVNFVYLAAALASYSRIVSMEDLQPVFEDMEEARRRRAHAREAETCSCDCT